MPGKGPGAAPRISADALRIVKELGVGGQGQVLRVEPKPPADPAPVAYKRYRGYVRSEVDVAVLEDLIRLFHRQDNSTQRWLADRAAWPTSLVYDAGTPIGFLMRLAPPPFFKALKMPTGPTDTLLALQFLLNEERYRNDRGIAVTDRHRLGLLRDMATTLAWMHEHDVAVGDLSPRNIVVSLEPDPRCFLLDCDAVRLAGASVLEQAETPDWSVPAGEEKATRATDIYKFSLLAIRLFAADQSIRDPDAIPVRYSRLRALARQSISITSTTRTSLGTWIDELDEAARPLSSATQHMPFVSGPRLTSPTSPAATPPRRPPPTPPASTAASPPASMPRHKKRFAPVLVTVLLLAGGILGIRAMLSSTASGSTALDRATTQAAAINELLQRSATDRGNLGGALNDVSACRNLATADALLRKTRDGRKTELASAKQLDASALTDGAKLMTDLVSALQHSLNADSDYVAWADGVKAHHCTKASEHSSAHTRGDNESKSATAMKRGFLDLWNSVAARYGFPQRQEPGI